MVNIAVTICSGEMCYKTSWFTVPKRMLEFSNSYDKCYKRKQADF